MASGIIGGTLRASIAVQHQNRTDADTAVAAAIDAHNRAIQVALTEGSGANQIETLWHDSRSCADGGTDDLDVLGNVIQNVFGEDLDFAALKAILVTNTHATSVLGILGAAANGIDTILDVSTTKLLVRPGGTSVLFAPDAAGYVITAATADIFGISDETGGGGVVPYLITLAGIR